MHVCMLTETLKSTEQACIEVDSADIGFITNTTSNISSTNFVLALVAGRRDCQPRPNSQ